VVKNRVMLDSLLHRVALFQQELLHICQSFEIYFCQKLDLAISTLNKQISETVGADMD